MGEFKKITSTVKEKWDAYKEKCELKRQERAKKEILGSNKKQKTAVMNSQNAVRFDPSCENGLTSEQVSMRMQDGLNNVTPKKGERTYFGIICGNVFTFFNVLTFIVAGALIWAGASLSQLFFLVIIIANILIGIIQEVRSKRIVDKLKLITAPVATVIRDGQKSVTAVSDLVLDDIVQLETGKQICADCIIAEGECEVNESIITGESVAVRKGKGDLLYSGSYISSGRCFARVDKIGSENYVETLAAGAKKYQKPKSELKNSIMLFIKVVTVFIIPLSILMIVGSLVRSDNPFPMVEDVQRTIMSTSGAIIGMIPAGMFLLTSLALAIGVIRLAKKNALVQDLYCIEMLARVDVLCLDKTGTLTDGTMKVSEMIPLVDKEIPMNDIIGSLISATGDNNQTAVALTNAYGSANKYKLASALPFSSQRKLSAASFHDQGTFALGAPEFVIAAGNEKMEDVVNQYASLGYRVVVLAHSLRMMNGDELPPDMEPLCVIAIEDHIREDAIDTINWFKENDVQIKIISGDNPLTVSEVAKRVGVADADKYISLEGFSSQEVVEAANQYTVFGRVTPEQKCLLIRAQKAKGHTVAMMGDGVNDILAMREADCSVAIAAGSEAARNVSHLVLLDSNFSSMPNVVVEGRRVVNNITKSSSLFLMKTLMSIVLSIIFLLLGKDYPLQTNHLLLLELFVIGLPSFFLALQTNTQRIQGHFLSNVISRAVPGGFALVFNVMAMFLFREFLQSTYGENALSGEVFTSLLVICIAVTGLMVLCKICEPFNAYRVFLIIITSTLMFISMVVIDDLGVVALNLNNAVQLAGLLYVIVLVLVTYFIVTLVMRLLMIIKVMTE